MTNNILESYDMPMRLMHAIAGILSILSLSACTSSSVANGAVTTLGWVLEDAGTDAEGKMLTRVSVYADTVNTTGELERTSIFDVETMPGCEHAPNGDVRCSANGYADEFRLQQNDRTVTFGHRNVPVDAADDGTPFETLKTFTEGDFSGTRLNIGVARTAQEPK